MKKALLFLTLALTIVLFSSCDLKSNGTIIVSITGMTAGNTHSLGVVVLDGITPVAASKSAEGVIAGGAASVGVYDLTMNEWQGDGGATYTLIVVIDMNDNTVLGDTDDYEITPEPEVEIDGDVTLTYTASDFSLVL